MLNDKDYGHVDAGCPYTHIKIGDEVIPDPKKNCLGCPYERHKHSLDCKAARKHGFIVSSIVEKPREEALYLDKENEPWWAFGRDPLPEAGSFNPIVACCPMRMLIVKCRPEESPDYVEELGVHFHYYGSKRWTGGSP